MLKVSGTKRVVSVANDQFPSCQLYQKVLSRSSISVALVTKLFADLRRSLFSKVNDEVLIPLAAVSNGVELGPVIIADDSLVDDCMELQQVDIPSILARCNFEVTASKFFHDEGTKCCQRSLRFFWREVWQYNSCADNGQELIH